MVVSNNITTSGLDIIAAVINNLIFVSLGPCMVPHGLILFVSNNINITISGLDIVACIKNNLVRFIGAWYGTSGLDIVVSNNITTSGLDRVILLEP